MAKKSAPKTTKRGKKVKNLRAGNVTAQKAKSVKGGTFEVQDYGFGVSMPVTTSRSDGGGATVKK